MTTLDERGPRAHAATGPPALAIDVGASDVKMAWLSEGVAMFFETLSLPSSYRRSGIGEINDSRWNLFRKNMNQNKEKKLEAMLANDDRIRNSRTAVDAYAASWAWTYFLIKWHPEEYTAYMKHLAKKPVLKLDDPQTRLADFREHFGEDLRALEDEFLRRMAKVK